MLDVLVVGAGQAGLAMGRELERAGLDFLLIDGAKAIGDSWRQRWDSLRLFTPAEFSSLRGLPFPAPRGHFPHKDEVAEYLRAYASAFSLPIALDEPVRSMTQNGPMDFTAETDYARYRARHVVIATGPFRTPSLPAVNALIAPRILQLHSSAYRNPTQIPDGPVLVVGSGASGVQIAGELSRTHQVTLAVGTAPMSFPARIAGRSVFYWLDRLGALDITADSFLGRRARRREMVVGLNARDLARRNAFRLVSRIVSVEHGLPCTIDRQRLDVNTVVWATGFRPHYPWLHVPVLDSRGRPVHQRGITRVPGVSFLGLPWQHTRGSTLLGWVARDAEYLAQYILASLPTYNHRSSHVGRRLAS
jgi:putative flavoprotein involved in K+ transport